MVGVWQPYPAYYVVKCGISGFERKELGRETWNYNDRSAQLGVYPILHVEVEGPGQTVIPYNHGIGSSLLTTLENVIAYSFIPGYWLEVALDFVASGYTGTWKRVKLLSDTFSITNLQGRNLGVAVSLDLKATDLQTTVPSIGAASW